ncbi:alpha/beta hydrolase [Streptomyces sp. CB01881]|uniref:alpha/beta fold hydrolase n=1 Tax=Streptomyces sp. CB01881 TaxID=2078691 RepID=UPI0011DFF560|nr:alpha/beta hydrolase [Streptomyces sp. CB01881]TYC66560.1 alpha/beta hydrolase [Streptomyces sp. CB01881]
MNTHHTAEAGSSRSRSSAVQDRLMAGAVLTTAVGVVVTELRKSGAPSAAPGRVVRVGGRALHVLDRPGQAPTVVLESGLGHPATVWSWVLEQLREDTRAVAYDRPGIGWSAAGRTGLDGARYPEHLLAVLARAGARAPFVLVGHSVGGLLIRIFTERHPELTAGLVFVDSAHPDQYRRSPRQRAGLPLFQQSLDRMITRAVLGLPAGGAAAEALTLLPARVSGPTAQAMFRFSSLRAARGELGLSQADWSGRAALLAPVTSCPVAVVSAAVTHEQDPAYAGLQRELGALSRVSRSQIVAGARHESLLTDRSHAARVTDAIHWVIDNG